MTVVIWQPTSAQQEILYCTGFTESGKTALPVPELPSAGTQDGTGPTCSSSSWCWCWCQSHQASHPAAVPAPAGASPQTAASRGLPGRKRVVQDKKRMLLSKAQQTCTWFIARDNFWKEIRRSEKHYSFQSMLLIASGNSRIALPKA